MGQRDLDKEARRSRYREERAKRLRADGNEQYLRLTGELAGFLDDPYTPVVERAPRTEGVTVAFIGGGFAGLVTAARLKEAAENADLDHFADEAKRVTGTWSEKIKAEYERRPGVVIGAAVAGAVVLGAIARAIGRRR